MNASIPQYFEQEQRVLRDFAQEHMLREFQGTEVDLVGDALDKVKRTLSKCKAESSDEFVAWAARVISRCPGFRGTESASRALDLDILGILNKADQQANFVPLDKYETPITLFIDMGNGNIWKVPKDRKLVIQRAEWTWAEVVERLWPCFLYAGRVYKKLKGEKVHVARILLEARSAEIVKFIGTDFLDYSAAYIVDASAGSDQQAFERATLKRTGWDFENVTAGVINAYDGGLDNAIPYASPTPPKPTADEADEFYERTHNK